MSSLFVECPLSSFRGEIENVSANQRWRRPSYFPIGPKNTNLVDDVEILLPIKFRWIRGISWKVLSKSDARAAFIVFRSARKTQTWKFRWIPCSSFIGQVENVSANQRTRLLSCFSDRPTNTKVENIEIFPPTKFRWPSLAVKYWARCWILIPSWIDIPLEGRRCRWVKSHVELRPRVIIPRWIWTRTIFDWCNKITTDGL